MDGPLARPVDRDGLGAVVREHCGEAVGDERQRLVPADAREAVAVGVGLGDVEDGRTVVDVPTHAVGIRVVGGVIGAYVTWVAQAVAVEIVLAEVGEARTVVDVFAEAVAIVVVGRVEGADVANIAVSVSVAV